jgi:hypothetical protein
MFFPISPFSIPLLVGVSDLAPTSKFVVCILSSGRWARWTQDL